MKFGIPLLLILGQLLAAGAGAAELSLAENQLPVSLGQYLDYLEDPGRTVTLADLQGSPELFAWQRSEEATPTLGLSNSAHWFRLNLRPRGLPTRKHRRER